MRTFTPKPADINRAWHVIDAEGQVLGKVATEAATLLRGKHKPIWAPHVDTGDHVVIVNAAKLDLSARKLADKRYHRHSGYPGGLSSESLEHLLGRDPERVVRLAVRGMLPKNRLGRAMIRKLRVYAGPTHPHHGPAAPAARAGVEALIRDPVRWSISLRRPPSGHGSLISPRSRRCPSPSSRAPAAARKPSPGCGSAPAPA